MKSVVRVFALLVSIVGLASASFAPANTHTPSRHALVSATGPASADLPGPLPCESDGTCLVQNSSSR